MFFAVCARLIGPEVKLTIEQSLPGDLSMEDWQTDERGHCCCSSGSTRRSRFLEAPIACLGGKRAIAVRIRLRTRRAAIGARASPAWSSAQPPRPIWASRPHAGFWFDALEEITSKVTLDLGCFANAKDGLVHCQRCATLNSAYPARRTRLLSEDNGIGCSPLDGSQTRSQYGCESECTNRAGSGYTRNLRFYHNTGDFCGPQHSLDRYTKLSGRDRLLVLGCRNLVDHSLN